VVEEFLASYEWVEEYYERLLKLANNLQTKISNIFLIDVFWIRLFSYLDVTIARMEEKMNIATTQNGNDTM
jgi:hypothetical protein